MISKERLKELIEQCAKVWCICDYTYDESKPNKKIEYYDLSNEDICISPAEFRDYGLRVFNALGYWNDIRFECLFETKEEAEWYKEFGCIERIEKLELPTWEEFDNRKVVEFSKDKLLYEFKKCGERIYISYRTYIDDSVWEIIFEKPATKENYTLACRKAKELFLGE